MAAYEFTENFGQVKRLYPSNAEQATVKMDYPLPPRPGKTFFQLKGGTTAMNPKNGYYYIPTTHNNYTALINLLYLAADRQWKISVRTDPALDPADGSALVYYLVVDF